MIKNVLFSVLSFVLLGTVSLHGQCSNDTIYSDVVFVIDNSGSIDSSEYAAFSNIILATVNKVQASCTEAQVGVVHYGGLFGQETTIEYPLSKNNVIGQIQRQYCTSLDMFGFCAGGGGDDLNYAMGDLITYFGNGSLNHNTANNLSIVIFTDAFDGAASCGQPNCSILRPFTNIDILKSNYDASVTVVGASMQANAALLQIYASPGGSYDLVNLDPDCATTFDGCVQPRKYIPIEFNSNVAITSDSIVSCVQCKFQIVAGMMVDAGNMQMICSDLPQTATLTATGSVGVMPYSYVWSHGAGASATVMVTPAMTTTYYVTATDAINCTWVDSVTVLVQACCTGYSVDAGSDRTICGDLGESTVLTASTTGSGSSMYNWDNGLGSGVSHTVTPSTTTTYNVTATSSYGCVDTDQVVVTVDNCGPDCDPDTTFTDVIFLLDNSGSIDDSEFSAFENIVISSLGGIAAMCPSSRRAVVHYGGVNGTSTAVEYSLGQVSSITTINRQFCTSRTPMGLCIGGGGDDLNNAIGDIMTFLNNGMLNRDPSNNLSLVIFTDAFGFDTSCGQPNCSLILPTTNIDQLKANYDADVSVIGISSQAEEALLGIYASPGGTFNSPLYAPECGGSFDGCVLPRKYVQIEFNTPPAVVSGMITSFVECVIEIEPELTVDAGPDVPICSNFGETTTLTASVGAGMGVPPYSYQWSNGLGSMQSVTVSPALSTTYYVTATDANLCTAVDSVTVNPVICDDCLADAGAPLPFKELCLENGQAILPSESNIGVVKPAGFEEIFILTNEDLIIIDYSVGFKNFIVRQEGLYRIHTLIAEVTNPASPDYLDLNIIKINESNLFLIVNCIVDHDICADFDFPGRVHRVLGPDDMMCMTFENSINLCSDGIDNDQDGLVDCADDDCKTLINCLENTLIACNDLTDNDGDGLIDCDDSDCFVFTKCFERGDLCKDGIDNDGDGLIDCDDDSCFGFAPCEENSAFTCKDGMDNDRDGLIDCQEASCQPFIVCAESTDAACRDGEDNDRDGLVDCADGDCKDILGEECNPHEDDIALCMDGIDNDDDGLIDCADPDCMTDDLLNVAENIDLLVEVIHATCPDNNNGKITFVGIAQNPDFQYSANGGQTYSSSGTFENLTVGPHNLAVKSALGCVLFVDVAVTGEACIEICNNGVDDDSDGLVDCADSQCNSPDPHNPQIINITGADCPDFTNGSFSIAQMPQNVQYSIDGINFQSLPKFSNLPEGVYGLSYRDQSGCYGSIEVIIPQSNKVCLVPEICNNGIDDDGDGLTDCQDAADCAAFDQDGDGICDVDDPCPLAANAGPGLTCDDGDACTINDVYDNDCNCAGTVQDSDGDGMCDAEDPCPFLVNAGPGISCDDGDPMTTNDVYDDACNCKGELIPLNEICDNGIDDDGDGLIDCQDVADCAAFDQDGDGICDSDDPCPLAPNAGPGTGCDDGDSCTIGDVYDDNCTCRGTMLDTDGDGVCDADDPCPLLVNAGPGVACDDGDPMTINDVYDSFCNCQGEVVVLDEICDNGIDDDGDGLVDCSDQDCQEGNNFIVKLDSLIDNDTYVLSTIRYENTTLSHLNKISTVAWTDFAHGSPTNNGRIFITFPIDQILEENQENPESAIITLYAELDTSTFEGQVGNNASTVHLISEPWIVDQILWSTQPSYLENPFVDIPSNTNYDKIEIDVTALLDKVKNEGLNFYGFMIKQKVEQPYRRMRFSSSNNKDQSRAPEIALNYTAGGCVEVCDNGIDDDGDGLIDCQDIADCASFDQDGDGVCDEEDPCPFLVNAAPGVSCDDGDPMTTNDVYDDSCNCAGEIPQANEICDNGIDDDGDGLVDCADNDCNTEFAISIKLDSLTGKDAQVNSSTIHRETNAGDAGILNIQAWTDFANNSPTRNIRGFVSFPIENILAQTPGTLEKALITFYEVPGYTSSNGGQFGDNALSVHLVSEPWEEDQITWNNQSAYLESPSITIPSNNNYQQIEVDVTDLLVKVRDENLPFYGFLLKQKTEEYYRAMVFSSSEALDQTLTPEISLTFSTDSCIEICDNGIDDDNDGFIDCDDPDCQFENNTIVEIKLNNQEGLDTYVLSSEIALDANFGDMRTLDVSEWVAVQNGPPETHAYSYIDFDIDQALTPAQDLDVAFMTLFADSLFTGNNGGQSGVNTTLVHLLNEPWDEDDMTWNSRPSYIPFPSVSIPQNNDYSKITVDVKPLLDLVIKDSLPFYGFFLQQQEKNPFRSMVFASSEHPDQSKTPEIRLEFKEVLCVNDTTPPNVAAALIADLNINVMLQGAIGETPSLMKTDLNKGGYLPGQFPETFFGVPTPAGQPFNQAPWFYEGREGKNMKANNKKSNESIYDPDVVDWILVSLRTEPGKLTEVWQGAALLYNDGSVEFFKPLQLDRVAKEGYYIVVEHRNHLPVMSDRKVHLVDNMIAYDFTRQNSFTSILGIGQIADEEGHYMMVAGNGELIVELSSDIDINVRDLTLWLQNNGANSSYFLEDYDMNGDINIKDRILWEKNNGLFTTLQTK